jgi:hypothetical protein
MKKILLTQIIGLALIGTAFADCAYTAGSGNWSGWIGDIYHRYRYYVAGSCYAVLNPTYCNAYTQSPDLECQNYIDGSGWQDVPPTGGSCTADGTAVCQIGY